MSDVAARVGVSRMAASAVLMGTGAGQIRVSEETAARIRAAAEELGYRPNPAASHLAGRESGILAIVGYDFRNFMAQRVLVNLHEAAEARGLRILATRLSQGLNTLEQLVRDVRAGWIDGLVYLAHENEADWPVVTEVLRDTPSVVIAVGNLIAPGVVSVISDVVPGAVATLDHLAERGRRRPVFLFEQMETPDVQARLAAYRERGRELGMDVGDERFILETKNWRLADPKFYGAFDDLSRRMLDRLKADCVVCDDDFNANGMMRSFRRLGLSVPADVSVVGWGDLQFASIFDPPISTVDHALDELMETVVSYVHGAEKSVSEHVLRVSTRLIVRESS